MNFKERFNLITQDVKIYSLSKLTGIERTKLQRIKSGERLPSSEELEKICRACTCSDEEKKKLKQALEIEIIGEDKYKSREFSKKFLADLSDMFQQKKSPQIEFNATVTLSLASDTIVTNGYNETINTIRKVLKKETSEENTIYLLSSAINSAFNELLTHFVDKQNITLRHLLSLEPHIESSENYFDNINSILKIYPLFLSNTNYYPSFNYNLFSSGELLPYYIVSDNFSINIAADFSTAIITQKQEVIDIHRKLLEAKIKSSYSFIKEVTDIFDYSRIYYERSENNFFDDATLFTLEYEPCVSPYLTQDMVIEAMNKSEFIDEELIKRALACFGDLHKCKRKFSFFSEKGLDSFVKTGRISEVPDFAYAPLPVEARKQVLKNFCRDAKDNKTMFPFIVKEDYLKFPYNMRYCGSGSVEDIFVLTRNGSAIEDTIFQLNECGFAVPLYDLLTSLPKSDMVYSVEETISIIESKIFAM